MAIHRTPIKTNIGVTSIGMYLEYCKGCDIQLTDGVERYSCSKCKQKYHKQCVDEKAADKRKMIFLCDICCTYRTRMRAKSCDERGQMMKTTQQVNNSNLNNATMVDDIDTDDKSVNGGDALEQINEGGENESKGDKEATEDEIIEGEITGDERCNGFVDLEFLSERMAQIWAIGKKEIVNETKKNRNG